ncbi:hypothetical protein PFHG_03996 [Plasmodium falciparum HB3]|uniref:Rifin n=1 Tax=Plasmodium falciparum (isolate HB3) TaxID=137071 RepID=A0A0L7KK73_PLAFX|nr:hypothetical protein PFHG_03996 [Plasmodium falciparum HB3]
MKLNYINITLFSLSLNILLLSSEIYNQRNHYITLHKPKIKPTKPHRSLCECELYAPVNYDNDPEMKAVMQDFDRQTSQRFHEFDERKIKNKQKCKEQCEKDIQKIILKDKIEKELTEKLSTLQTKIETNDIPTCVCEKSVADKTEKFCHDCGYGLGSVAPSIGLLGVPGMYGWKTAALAAATKDAITKGLAAGEAARIKAGIDAVILGLNSEFGLSTQAVQKIGLVINAQNYKDAGYIYQAIFTKYQGSCMASGSVRVPVTGTSEPICKNIIGKAISGRSSEEATIKSTVKAMVSNAEEPAKAAAEAARETAINAIKARETGLINTIFMSKQTAIIASVVAIVVIVLIMIIIYLILRYRRKKKMKKKLQYIKLLEE